MISITQYIEESENIEEAKGFINKSKLGKRINRSKLGKKFFMAHKKRMNALARKLKLKSRADKDTRVARMKTRRGFKHGQGFEGTVAGQKAAARRKKAEDIRASENMGYGPTVGIPEGKPGHVWKLDGTPVTPGTKTRKGSEAYNRKVPRKVKKAATKEAKKEAKKVEAEKQAQAKKAALQWKEATRAKNKAEKKQLKDEIQAFQGAQTA